MSLRSMKATKPKEKLWVQYHRLSHLLETLELGQVDGSCLKVVERLQRVDLPLLANWGLEGFKGKQITDLLNVIED